MSTQMISIEQLERTSATTNRASISTKQLWAGRFLNGLAALFMVMDGTMKIVRSAPVLQANAKLGYPVGSLPTIGLVLLACTVLYVIPRTSIFGAILITGYLGGAVASQVRAGSGWFELIFPILFAVVVWGGLWLRDQRMRRILAIAAEPRNAR